MCNEPIFYLCSHCGNLIEKVFDAGVPIYCCGEPMKELTPNTSDAAQEKHVPLVKQKGAVVEISVGEVLHPMSEEHSISWVLIQTDRGTQKKCLLPTDPPQASFALQEEKLLAVYAYCNLHGLWKTEL